MIRLSPYLLLSFVFLFTLPNAFAKRHTVCGQLKEKNNVDHEGKIITNGKTIRFFTRRNANAWKPNYRQLKVGNQGDWVNIDAQKTDGRYHDAVITRVSGCGSALLQFGKNRQIKPIKVKKRKKLPLFKSPKIHTLCGPLQEKNNVDHEGKVRVKGKNIRFFAQRKASAWKPSYGRLKVGKLVEVKAKFRASDKAYYSATVKAVSACKK